MQSNKAFYSLLPLLCLCVLLGFSHSAFAEPSMGEYTSYPVFQTNTVAPNILIMMDNSGSMNQQAYTGSFDDSRDYYGYFVPEGRYTYGLSKSNVFQRDSNGDWSGNFLNWLTMRRVDVARKALMGGKATSRTGGGNQHNIGETPAQSTPYYETYTHSEGNAPTHSGSTNHYAVSDGSFYVDDDGDGNYEDNYKIEVEHDENDPGEEDNFVDGNLAGVMQKIGTKARWGVEFYNDGDSGSNENGGEIAIPMNGTSINQMANKIQNKASDTWTPLAEAYHVATKYFKQEEVELSGYPNNVVPISDNKDPYYFKNNQEFVHCAKSFVLLLTDGASTMDEVIPEHIMDYDGDGNDLDDDGNPDNSAYNSEGTDFLDDYALYSRTNDLRSDLNGTQSMILYPVYAFGSDDTARNLLQSAAKNGGFVDENGNQKPDLQSEWDKDGDGVPDTYFEAQDGAKLETQLTAAINAILERAASGTAVSVLATSQEGEGNIVQAYFRPQVTKETRTLNWLGYLHSLWVDSRGNLREDSNGNNELDLTEDKVARTFTDSDTGDTKVKLYDVNSTHKYPEENATASEEVALQDVKSLWNAGERLAERNATDRDIFTYLDKDNNNATDTGEVVDFHTDNDSLIEPYLGVKDDTVWSHLGNTTDERVDNIINFVRGKEVSGLRTRNMGNGTIWKLGDIVHSTPMVVSGPVENYHTLYGDETYDEYVQEYKNRETMVYVGANDGLFHAFTAWDYNKDAKKYEEPDRAESGEQIGDEVWAYAPQNLLPHLKWLPDRDYTHVYYVDQKPRVFDARILPDDKHYTSSFSGENWGTFVLCGMRLGGKQIQSDDGDYNDDGSAENARDFHSAYFLIDVTDPRNPELMWERSYKGLNLTTSRPAIMRVGEGNWYAIFGSGPEDYDGTAPNVSQGKVYVIDLETGDPVGTSSEPWLFETNESDAFMGSPVAFDRATNFNVDAAYIGETHDETDGKLYKISVPVEDSNGDYELLQSNYEQDPDLWRMDPLFDPGRPVTASLSVSVDKQDNVWIYGGTGRYFRDADKSNDNTQYKFGVKDPFYNSGSGDYHEYDFTSLDKTYLYDVTGINVTSDGVVYDASDNLFNGNGEWDSLVNTVEAEDGWYFALPQSRERIIEKPTVLGGAVLTPSFIPSTDICGYGGDSYLYAVYYTTGTAYTDAIIGTEETYIGSELMEVNRKKLSLGTGKASSVSMHVGQEEGATGIIQESTGNIEEIGVDPAHTIKSGIIYWKIQ